MPRGVIGRLGRELWSDDEPAREPGAPEDRRRGLSRRELLAGGLTAAALGAGALWLPQRARSVTAPRVVVVGAGFAGLTAAYRMWKEAAWTPAVYEARDRVGGRVHTIRTFLGGQVAEAGAQGISTNDHSAQRLVAELGLSLLDMFEDYPSGRTILRFDGVEYTRQELKPDLRVAGNHAWRHFRQIDWPVSHANANARARHWDSVSVADWIDGYCPGGPEGPAGRFLKTYFEAEYASPADQASSIELIVDLGSDFDAGYDERYTIAGGNDRLASTISGLLPAGAVRYGMALVAIRRNADDTYTCTFDADGSLTEVAADRVVLALPFSVLRTLDYSNAGFSALKDRAIRELGMGVNSKLNFQFRGTPWEPRSSGESISDLVTGWTWESQSYQPGTQGILTQFNGGTFATSYGDLPIHGPAPDPILLRHLHAIDELFPGASDRLIPGQGYLDYWPADPWVHGSYSYYRTGGFTTIAGAEATGQGGVHFAGEHTAPYGSQATMNGAVYSGERAAKEILRAYGYRV